MVSYEIDVDSDSFAPSAERIYNLIDKQQDQDSSNGEGENPDGAASGGDGGKQPDKKSAGGEPTAPVTPGGIGQVLDAPQPKGDDGDTVAEQAREWKIAVEQAENVAKLAGKLPVGVTRSLEQSQAAGVDWRELLRQPSAPTCTVLRTSAGTFGVRPISLALKAER